MIGSHRIFLIIVIACLLVLVCPAPAEEPDGSAVSVLYQTAFSANPHWITNNPSLYYWSPVQGVYHFAIEPSTGAYAYIPVAGYEGGPFTLEYDLVLSRIDEGATFRLGFSGEEMDPMIGPNILTQFTNAKFGRIMWLHLITPGNNMIEVNSKSGDTRAGGRLAYTGPNAYYSLNETYHVVVNYDRNQHVLGMTVREKSGGKDVWSYFVKTSEDLHEMNRIYLGSIGDYGMMNTFAEGFIDNVRLTVPPKISGTTDEDAGDIATFGSMVEPGPAPVRKNTTMPKKTVPTPYAPDIQEAPVPAGTAVVALCAGFFIFAALRRK